MIYRCPNCDYEGDEIKFDITTESLTCIICGCNECYEFEPYTDEQQEIYDWFFGDYSGFIPIVEKQHKSLEELHADFLLWENYNELVKLNSSEPLYIYTLVSCENDEEWIYEGFKIVNALGYYGSKVKKELPGGCIRAL